MNLAFQQETQNNLKVETISSQSLNEQNEQNELNQQNEQNQMNEQNELTNQQDSQENRGMNDDDIKFSCKCGKYYSRNASLFNHIRIKHENKITAWKVFEGMRKQGRPKKEQVAQQQAAAAQQANEQIDPYNQKIQCKKETPQEMMMMNGQMQRNQNNGETFKKYQTFPNYDQNKSNNEQLQKAQKYNDDVQQKLQIDKRFQYYQTNQPNAHQNQALLYLHQNLQMVSPHYYQEQHQQQMNMLLSQRQNQQFTQFIYQLQEEKPRHSLSMDIIIRFKDILIDSNDEPLTEKEEIDYLVKLFAFQNSIFQKHKIDYEFHRTQFECFYTFLRYWMRFIKREKIEDTFKEYITFQFSKIIKVNIDQSAVMERLQKIYDDFEKKNKIATPNSNIPSKNSSLSTAPIHQNTSAAAAAAAVASSAHQTNTTPNEACVQNSSPSESTELPATLSLHGTYPPPLYPAHYPPRGQFYPGAPYPPPPFHPSQLSPPIMNPLSLPIPNEGLYNNHPPNLPGYPHSENDQTQHIYRNYNMMPRQPHHLSYPPYFDGSAAAAAAFSKQNPNIVGNQGVKSFQHPIHSHDKKHTSEISKESR